MAARIQFPAVLFAICLSALTLSGCKNVATDVIPIDGRTEIRVGRVAPLTGELSSFGFGTPQWEEIAIDYINEQLGGIYIEEAGEKLPVRLITADSHSSSDDASEAAMRLIEDDNIDVMIVSNTVDTVNPVSAVCERNGVPCFSVDAPADAWRDGGPYTYSFHAFFDTESELSCFVDAWDLLDSNRKVGVLCANDAEGIEVATSINEYAGFRGYTVVDPGRFSSGEEDFGETIEALRENDCEIVVGVMETSDFTDFWRQCSEMRYTPKAVTVAKATLFETDVQAIGGGLGDGVISEVWWTVNHPFTSSLTGQSSLQLGEQWMAEMRQDYAQCTVGYKHANVEILYDILNRAGSLDVKRILEAAAETDLNTVVGRVRYKSNHVSIMNLVTGQWVQGEDGSWTQEIIANYQIPETPVTADIKVLPGWGPE